MPRNLSNSIPMKANQVSNSSKELEIGAPMVVKVLSVIGLSAGFGMLAWTLDRFGQLTTVGRILMPAAVLLFLLGGLDGLQRKYIFRKSAVRMRILFVWRTWALPPNVLIEKDQNGQVLLRDALAETRIMRIPREYDRQDGLSTALKTLYGAG